MFLIFLKNVEILKWEYQAGRMAIYLPYGGEKKAESWEAFGKIMQYNCGRSTPQYGRNEEVVQEHMFFHWPAEELVLPVYSPVGTVCILYPIVVAEMLKIMLNRDTLPSLACKVSRPLFCKA